MSFIRCEAWKSPQRHTLAVTMDTLQLAGKR